MRDLDVERRLAGERADLLGQIKVPELGVIHTRARAVKRRRRVASAAAALALLGTVGGGVGILRNGTGAVPPDMAASGTPGVQTPYRGSGLTIWPLTVARQDLPGRLYSVEFADAEHGYAIAAQCLAASDVCELTFATTADGGVTWSRRPPPIDRAPARSLPILVAFGTGQVGLIGEAAWTWNGGAWSSLDATSLPSVASVPAGGRLWMWPGDGCEPGPLYVWQTAGGLGRLAGPPGMAVCRVARGTGDAWWVGGYVAGASGRQPAVAVSRDAGRTWQQPLGLPSAGPDAWAQVSPLGSDVYASVVSLGGGEPEALRLHNVYRSAAGGAFQSHGPNSGTFVGEVVPLLDGGLLVASNGWFLSTRGGPLVRDRESLPYVGRLARTPGGWLALDLFRSGYAAFSPDGVNWQKLNVY